MEITTIKDLNEHKGEYLAFVTGNVVWITKLDSIILDDTSPLLHASFRGKPYEISGLATTGLYTTQVYPTVKKYFKKWGIPHKTNAQISIRIPTKDEMNIFRKFIRHYRIFGK